MTTETKIDATKPARKPGNSFVAWIVRFFKGFLAGIGAITPGLSGGVMLVVFGIYEPLLRWLADIRKKFIEHLRFFLPVGIGGFLGVVAFRQWLILLLRTMRPSSLGSLSVSSQEQFHL